jgi:hypothetical protein
LTRPTLGRDTIEGAIAELLRTPDSKLCLTPSDVLMSSCPRCLGNLIVPFCDGGIILPFDSRFFLRGSTLPGLTLHLCPDVDVRNIYRRIHDAKLRPDSPILRHAIVAILDSMLDDGRKPSPDAIELADDPVLGRALKDWPLGGEGRSRCDR